MDSAKTGSFISQLRKEQGLTQTALDVEQWKYAEGDDVYLKGKSANGEKTKDDWFLLKQLSDTLYYYEYHYKY